MVFFNSNCKYLQFDKGEFIPGQIKENDIPNGVKSLTLQENPEELKKVEYKTLHIKCDLSIGSEFSSLLLQKMITSLNKELFRCDMTILLEYKWNQLKTYVFLQNLFLMSYVIYFIMVKIGTIKDNLGLFIFTIVVMVPEIK